VNRTHDPKLTSWVESANDPATDFPIQNLPFGTFRRKGSNESPRGGVAIGDQILDLAALGLKTGPNLNRLAAAGPKNWSAIRKVLSSGLSDPKAKKRLSKFLLPMSKAELVLPVEIGDYSDFFTGIHHATNTGRMFRPDSPLLPNYHWVPIGYHGRASSIVVSGTPVVRPSGQRKAAEFPEPVFGPSRRLDFELEVGFVIGPGNPLGKPIPVARALDHVFGMVLFNDWSARDIQAWEYQPLGPFLAKSFASTMSPWIVTMEALEPFRCPAFARSAEQPAPLPYLSDDEDRRNGNFDIQLEALLRTSKMSRAQPISRSNFRHAFWTPAQVVAHQASNGCNLRPGDLLASGTISGPTRDALGSMLELSDGGKRPLQLSSGETRSFLEDGDQVVLRARCTRPGRVSIGFGEAAGTIRKASAP
jgi:fumarylacetoacetase